MERVKQIVTAFAMILVLLAIFSVAMAQQQTIQKQQAVKEMQKPPAKILPPAPTKLSDMKDTDIIEVKGKRMTVAEAKALVKKNHETAARQAQVKFARTAEQGVQQLRAVEESKKRSHVQRINQDIASEIKRQPDQLCSRLYSDNKPHIRSVYPTTVNPGDPILIKGCGFLSQPGQATYLVNVRTMGPGGAVLIIPKSYNLTIKSWTDTAIEASIPEVTGSGNASLGVTNSQGLQSSLSGFILTQWIDYQILKDPKEASSDWEYSFVAWRNGSGRSTHLQNVSLLNNWRVERTEFRCGYNEPSVESGPLGIPIVNLFNDIACNWPEYGAAMVPGTQPQPGDSHIKGISVEWKTKTTSVFEFVYYVSSVIIKGPKGTSPY